MQKFEWALRYMSHSEKKIFLEVSKKTDYVILDAHFIAACEQAMANTVSKEIAGVEFVIDPKTASLNIEKRYDRKLLEAYNIDAEEEYDIKKIIENGNKEEFVSNVINFQKDKIKKITNADPFENETESQIVPKFVIPPYLMIEEPADIEKNKELYEIAKKEEEELRPVIYLSKELLSEKTLLEETIEKIQKEYRGDIFIWINELNAYTDDREILLAYAKIVEKLKESSINPIAFYGSYFALLLSKKGLGGVSHGIQFGESKGVPTEPRKGFSSIVRYYCPKLKRRYTHVILKTLQAKGFTEITEGIPIEKDHKEAEKHFLKEREKEIIEVRTEKISLDIPALLEKHKEKKLFEYYVPSNYLKNWEYALKT